MTPTLECSTCGDRKYPRDPSHVRSLPLIGGFLSVPRLSGLGLCKLSPSKRESLIKKFFNDYMQTITTNLGDPDFYDGVLFIHYSS